MTHNKTKSILEKDRASTKNNSSQNQWVFTYFLALVVLILLGYAVNRFIPLFEFYIEAAETIPYEEVAPGWASEPPIRAVLEPWLRWDTVWYLKIAKFWYQPASPENVFAPMYPFLIRIFGRILGGQYLIASLLISWSSLFGVCYLLNERIHQYYPDLDPSSGIRNMIFFPTAIFLFAGYTESLFLFLVLLAWRYAERRNWLLVNLLGSITVLVKFFGLFLLLPFGYIWWKNKSYKKITPATFSFLLLPLAYFSWTRFMALRFQLSPSEILMKFWPGRIDMPWAALVCNITKFNQEPILVQLDFLFNVLAIIVVLWALFWWLKRKAYPEILFIGSIFLFSIMQISEVICMVSTSRHILTLFPIYLAQPVILQKPIPGKIFQLLMVLIWMLCATLYFAGLWIA